MYRIGDAVIYGTEGICTVVEVSERTFGGKTDMYYVLKPLYKNGSTVMLPVSNELLVARIKRVLTKSEAQTLISSIPRESVAEWIDNEKQRKEHYRALLMNCDRTELVRHIKCLYERCETQKQLGKKLHACDERFLEEAQRMLHDEFSLVLGTTREEILGCFRGAAAVGSDA